MDYPAGTVLGTIRIELCFDLNGDCISSLIQNKRLLGNWYENSIVILVPVTLLLSKKF
jgi:hypothetical protein